MANKKFPKNKPITIPIQKYNIKRIQWNRFKNVVKYTANRVFKKIQSFIAV